MREFVIHRFSQPKVWLVLFVPGMALIGLGVLIVIVPQLLVAMVAALFICAGLGLASVGWRLRNGGMQPRSPFGDSGPTFEP